MRRPVAVASITALALALSSPAAFAFSPLQTPPARYDLSRQLMLRLFGETSDTRASFAAAYGDRSSESPLRNLALPLAKPPQAVAFVPDLALAPTFARASVPRIAPTVSLDIPESAVAASAVPSAKFTDPSPPANADLAQVRTGTTPTQSAAFTVGEYQPVQALPLVSPGPGAFSFGPMVRGDDSAFASSVGSAPGARGSTVSTPSSVRVGRVQFEGDLQSGSTQVPQISLRDSTYGAGASFNVRAGKRNLGVNFSSGYEQLQRNDTSTVSAPALGTTSSWQLPGADAPLLIPNYAQMNKLSVAAGVAVPVRNGLTLNLNYDAQRLYGGYGLPGLANLDAIGNSYGGKLTFEIPHSSSTLSISAAQYRYLDNVLPLNSTTQTRADVNFMIKF